MPELPDVEGYRRLFADHAAGRTVRRVWADPTIVRNATPRSLDRAMHGRRFDQPERHGKWLTAWTDGPALLFHFGMTGWFTWSDGAERRHPHDRLSLELDGGGELRYRNMRKIGGVWLAHDRREAEAVTGPLGPDALAMPTRRFRELLARRRGGVKAALMDQTVLAGVGNLIADETLWQARIHPRARIDRLTEEDIGRLARSLRKVLAGSVELYGGTPYPRSWLLSVRGRPDARCPRCGSPLERTVAGGRTTYFCPRDQPAPPAS